REELIAAHDGRRLWYGEKNQDVMAVNDGYAVIRSADRRTFSGRSFLGAGGNWRRSVNDGATAALTPYAAIIPSTSPRRIIALSPARGHGARGGGPPGWSAGEGRDMAYLPFR